MLQRRSFGNTGLQVSELILGAGYVGGIVINASDETRRTLIRRLLGAGINWIDTAESYGQGLPKKPWAGCWRNCPRGSGPMFPPSFVSIPPGWTISLGRSNDRWRAA